MSSSIYSDYVADMNILLSYYKAMDDWNDDRSVLKLAFAKLLKTKHPDDGFDYNKKAEVISSLLTELGTREKENETNIDVMAGLFGRIMSVLFVPKDDQWLLLLAHWFFLGQFIIISLMPMMIWRRILRRIITILSNLFAMNRGLMIE